MTDQRANLCLLCNTCGLPVEVMLGLPIVDDATGRVLTKSTAARDHVGRSPACQEGTFTVIAGAARPEEYAALKAMLPGVPTLMLWPGD